MPEMCAQIKVSVDNGISRFGIKKSGTKGVLIVS